MKLKGRKASLYATAMAISLVALTGTAHAQSASNGKFKASALPTAQAAGGVKSTTTSTKATLTTAEIDALKVTETKKIDLKVRNDVSAKVLGSLSAASKTAFDNALAAVADLDAKDKAKAAAAALLDASAGTAVAAKTLPVTTAPGGVVTVTNTSITPTAVGVVSGGVYITDSVAGVGKFVYADADGADLSGSGLKWTASAKAAKDIADALVQTTIAARSAAGAEVAAATAAVGQLQLALNTELALSVPSSATAVAEKTAALAAGQTRLSLATTAQTAANVNYTNAVTAADKANSTFQTSTNSKIAADNAQVTSLSAKNFAEQAVSTALASDTGYKAAIAEVKAATDALVLTAGQNLTQAQVDYYKSYGVDVTAVVGGGAVGAAITAAQVTAANASLAGVTNAKARALTTNLASLVEAAALDDQTKTTTTSYSSNGYTRTTGVLTTAAASTSTSIAMASNALTGAESALDVNAQFEIEVLDTLVNHETRITAIEDVVGDVVANTAAIALETTERKAADAVLTTAIATEVTERKAADAALDTRVTATANGLTKEVADRIAADTANNNARIAEDTRLAGLITAESNARVAMGQELRDRIASSTATAIALGGAALLPDMGFTLSGNVAFYEGAQAIALNAAAKVGPNAYVTAAAGGGLNKRGSVGGRVGFVIGF